MDHRAHAFAQADPVAVQRRLVEARGVATGTGLLLCTLALLNQIRARPFPLGRNVGEDVHPCHADAERKDRCGNRPPAATDEGEHDEARGEREQ
jgi:hypothetical protein